MVEKRRRLTQAFKFPIALAALEASKTISQLPSKHKTHAKMIRTWERQLLEHGPNAKR